MTASAECSSIAKELGLLKTDALGRVQTSPQKREAILDAFEASGMRGPAFARHIGVKYPTFATWVQKRRRRQEAPLQRDSEQASSTNPSTSTALPGSLTLIEAVVSGPEGSSGPSTQPKAVELVSAQGVTLRVHDEEQVALAVALYKALEAPVEGSPC